MMTNTRVGELSYVAQAKSDSVQQNECLVAVMQLKDRGGGKRRGIQGCGGFYFGHFSKV